MAAPTADRSGAETPGSGPGGSGSPHPVGSGLVERLWEGRGGAGAWVLGPLLTVPELVFRGAVALRNTAYDADVLPSRPAPVPAVSVGNLTVGGTGKTPLVRWIVRELLARGATPGVLHGGYADDEPALHRRWFPDLPVVAEKDRVRGAERAVEHGADVLVLDDAFQHRRLRRDLDLVLVAAERWTPRPRLLPRGPYREPLGALERADLVVVTRRTAAADAAGDVARSVRRRTNRPTAVAYLGPGPWLDAEGRQRTGEPGPGALAVAAIGRPEAFFRQLAEQGVRLGGALTYRDHHTYTKADADRIVEEAEDHAVITTAKDAVKLAPLLDVDLWVLEQTVTVEDGRERLLEQLTRLSP